MNKKWKRLLSAAVCACVLSGFGGTAPSASAFEEYQLSDEVKNPTPALLQASQIGVITYDNPLLAERENRDAILLLSFGTTFKDTREKTIDAVTEKIKKAFPDKEVRVAFTSHIIIDRILENEGLSYPTPEEAFDQLAKEGYTRVAVVSLNIVPGIEYDYNRLATAHKADLFKRVTLGTPIMYYMGQEEAPDQVADFVQAVKQQLPKRTKHNQSVLLLAHGTPHPANAYYSVIQDRLENAGLNNVFVYSVEGRPHLEDVIPELKARGVKNVLLMPIMMGAGDHANNDMAGDEEDSHKSILQKEGFTVDTYIHGLGENPAIQDLFLARTQEAVAALNQ